ncbi:MarR family transcriptional regulator [Geodermatophilus sp. SYSU D00742]
MRDDDEVLLTLARAVVGVSTRAAGRLGGVPVAQLRALTVLAGLDGGKLAALADVLGTGVSAASRLVDRLVVAGLADRQPAPHTRREVVLRPTGAGRALLDRYDDLRLTELRVALDGLPADRRAAVLDALSEYGRALGGTRPGPAGPAAPAGPGAASSAADPAPRRPVEPEGGDPPCWLQRVCPACGRMADEDPPTHCPACGELLPAE